MSKKPTVKKPVLTGTNKKAFPILFSDIAKATEAFFAFEAAEEPNIVLVENTQAANSYYLTDTFTPKEGERALYIISEGKRANFNYQFNRWQ